MHPEGVLGVDEAVGAEDEVAGVDVGAADLLDLALPHQLAVGLDQVRLAQAGLEVEELLEVVLRSDTMLLLNVTKCDVIVQ